MTIDIEYLRGVANTYTRITTDPDSGFSMHVEAMHLFRRTFDPATVIALLGALEKAEARDEAIKVVCLSVDLTETLALLRDRAARSQYVAHTRFLSVKLGRPEDPILAQRKAAVAYALAREERDDWLELAKALEVLRHDP